MHRGVRAFLFAFAILCGLALPALALPKTVIILRHGEKENVFASVQDRHRSLACACRAISRTGREAFAVSAGRAACGLFRDYACIRSQLASPAAATWEMPVTTFSAVPLPGIDLMPQLNLRTQQAVGALMDDPRYDGKTVVMVWEHRHIADKALELKFPDQKVTLRQLLNLDKLPDVPETWPGQTYDYFWIVEFGTTGSRVPAASARCRIRGVRQVPSNEWGKRAKLPLGNKCLP